MEAIFSFLKTYLSSFTKQIRLLCMLENLAFKTLFSLHNIHLSLCREIENFEWILRAKNILKLRIFGQKRNENESDSTLFFRPIIEVYTTETVAFNATV